MSDAETVGDEIDGFVSGLLGLVGIEADPLSSREHILLSNLIMNEWSNGRSLDLPTLVGMALTPPIRKLGVFEIDAFFPPADRTAFAMRLNGLLASPSFGSWMSGTPLDIETMLHTPDGRPRCAIVTTAHLGDQERQFVTTLVLSKLVTWMRRQSGTTDLRALLYMDEVAGYLPPTAMPPTKKPIMTLMKQARAFGVGVVLSTQNPVDVDYKALSNAGTWMIGRLQTEQDKQRLLDGMSAASGGVDVAAVSQTIGGLSKREFVLRRAGKDTPEVFTTRWAMSYLRGPLTRDQISTLMAIGADRPSPACRRSPGTRCRRIEPACSRGERSLPRDRRRCHHADARCRRRCARCAGSTSPRRGWPTWAATRGARAARRRPSPGSHCASTRTPPTWCTTRSTRRCCIRWASWSMPAAPCAVDHDERDLQTVAPAGISYVLGDAPIKNKTYWTKLERDLDRSPGALSLDSPSTPIAR